MLMGFINSISRYSTSMVRKLARSALEGKLPNDSFYPSEFHKKALD
jgi:hypothetical protein